MFYLKKNSWRYNMNQPDRFDFLIDSFPFAQSIAKILLGLENLAKKSQLYTVQLDSFPGIFTNHLFQSLTKFTAPENPKIHCLIQESDPEKYNRLKTVINAKQINCQISNDSEETLLNSNNPEVIILNNILSTETNLEKRLTNLAKSQEALLIIGCELSNKKCPQLNNLDGYELWSFKNHHLSHYAYINKKLDVEKMSELLDAEFKNNNACEQYLDLVLALNQFTSPQTIEQCKFLLDELLKLDSCSANTHFLIAKFFKINGNKAKASEHFKTAKLLDPYSLLKIPAH